jgi:hypothetical protein
MHYLDPIRPRPPEAFIPVFRRTKGLLIFKVADHRHKHMILHHFMNFGTWTIISNYDFKMAVRLYFNGIQEAPEKYRSLIGRNAD